MRKLITILAFLLLFLLGCGEMPRFHPEITTQLTETDQSVSMRIQHNAQIFDLDSKEEIKAYRPHVERLLKKLDEAEKRMEIMEVK